jgi:hypothetical protein
MKTYFLTIVFAFCCILFLNSCEAELNNEAIDEKAINACGVTDPTKNLPWLVELIEKAKSDMTGNYYGIIWLEKYNEQDVFVTNMMLGSGGIAYYVFDCEGNPVTIENALDFFNNLKKDVVIYVHSDYPLNL